MHRTRKSALRKRKTSTKEENTAKVSKLDFTNDDGFLPLTASISGLLNHRRPRVELHLGEASVSDFLEGQVTLILRAICYFSCQFYWELKGSTVNSFWDWHLGNPQYVSVLERCLSYRESSKGSKERQGPALGVRLIVVSVKRESTVL